jgi:hypothetical protein
MTYRSGLFEVNGKVYRVTNELNFDGSVGQVEVFFERRTSKWDTCPSKTSRWIGNKGKAAEAAIARAAQAWGQEAFR